MAPLVPTTDVAPVADKKYPEPQEPAVEDHVEPTPKPNQSCIPTPLFVAQVPVVSPGIVTVLYSKVFADEIV